MTTSASSPSGSSRISGSGTSRRSRRSAACESLAIIDLFDTQDMVAEEVNQAHARLQSAAVRVVQADRALRTGIITFNGTVEGLEQTSRFGDVLVLISRPQEAVYALQLLKRAFDEYFTTVAEYNRAQFELFHALGYPAREVAQLRTARRGPAGGHGAAALPAAGRQRAAPGHPMNDHFLQTAYRGETYPLPPIGSEGMLDGLGSLMRDGSANPWLLALDSCSSAGSMSASCPPSPPVATGMGSGRDSSRGRIGN